MMTLAERLKKKREEIGLTQADLAKKSGIKSQATIGMLETGIRKSSSYMPKIAKALGVSYEWLTEGKGEVENTPLSNVIAHHLDDPLPEGLVLIPEYKVSFSAGNGSINYEIEEASPKIYEIAWFAREGFNHKNAKRFRVTGNSMEPTLYQGDSVLVNMAENSFDQIIEGAIYALRYSSELRVKRIFRKLDGSLVLHSDNPMYKQEELPPEMVNEHITIIGRVRDKSGVGGLIL